jgi:phage shock protein C
MSISMELEKLGELHQRGTLSDEEFARAKTRVLGGTADVGGTPAGAIHALRRSRDERWLGGVCGGLARSTDMPPWTWRLMFTLLALCAGGGVLVYLLLWIFMPQD